MENRKIVFLTGVIGSGKDYNSEKYIQEGYEKLAFADGVRTLAWQSLGWKPKDEEEYVQFKDMTLNLSTKEKSISEITGRDYLINIGDGFRNILDPKLWIKMLHEKIKASSNDKFVISDCRYPNEILYFFATYDIEVKFCNYKSSRYNPSVNNRSEWMAQRLIELDFKDGEEVHYGVIIDLMLEFNGYPSEISK